MNNVRELVVDIDSPIVEEGTDVTHTGTSWQITRFPDMTKREYFIIESLNDTENLLQYKYDIDINETESLYVRTKYHFSNGLSSRWSKIVPLRSDQIGVKLSSTVLSTPLVEFEINHVDTIYTELTLKTNDMQLYAGAGNHKSTTWNITDIDGKVIFNREKDEDNLTSITIDAKILKPNKVYAIKAKHHTDSNADSNFGKVYLTTHNGETSLFEIVPGNRMVPNRYVYCKLSVYTNKFSRVDLIIKDSKGNIVASNLDQLSRTPRIFTGDLKLYNNYSLYARITLVDGTKTQYKHVVSEIMVPNTLIDMSNNINYLGKYSFNQELLLGGLTVQSTSETYAGDIFYTKHNDNNIYRFKYNSQSKLSQMEVAATLDGDYDLFDKPYINIVPMFDGRIIVDYSADLKDGKVRRSTFKQFEYNNITKVLQEINVLHRDNELYGTATTTSAVPVHKNFLYYIPNKEIDNDGNSIPLRMKILDAESFVMDEIIDLPYSVTRHATLVRVDNSKLLLVGGSNEEVVDTSGEVWREHVTDWKRYTNDIYVFDIPTKTWSKVGELPADTPEDLYAFQGYLRRDRKIVLFNSVDSGSTVGNQDVYIIDTVDYSVTKDSIDEADNLIYRNSIVLNNGDILRISSRVLDPQKVYRYVSDTLSDEQLIDNDVIDVITDLIVKPGQEITIESPYRYTSITIEGTSYEDSGVLKWIDGDRVREFRYRDKIVTRPEDFTNNLYDPTITWDTLTILEDAYFNIHNVIIVPDNVRFEIHSPFSVEEIMLGDGAELVVINDDE